MARTKIDYGIDLGTTNSAISRMQNGVIEIKKSLDTQKDTTPSCVAYNKKGNILVGDSAYRVYRSERLKSLSKNKPLNSFIEFKRTMGTNEVYYSSNLEKDLSSEELSAEVLKRLKEYIDDENINAAVITVPAAFKINQIDATRRAAKLAGLDQVEVLQEPVAAAITYGLNSKSKNGFWLVFDFGGGTFDSALLKVEDGIQKVVDSEGDNHLGGKNLDFAIVDNLIIPHIEENYSIEDILGDSTKRVEYRNSLKFFAEEIKNNLSFNKEYSIYVDPGDCGEDDDGEEIEIDLVVTQDDLKRVLGPVFQKAIDCSLELLRRNNLSGNALETLILVGGPTYSPVLRQMLKEQICEPDTSVDPMTVVSNGAAIFASTVDVVDEIKEKTLDFSKIQLEVSCESTSVETEEFVTIKILEDKTQGTIPEVVYAEINRGDDAWSSGKIEINTIGEVLDVQLNEGHTNVFNIRLFDDKGNIFDCEPCSFTIIQGIGGTDSMNTLPYNIGIEITDKDSGKDIFTTVPGLERNKSLPVTGVLSGLKTQTQIRPGNESDALKIAIFQGEHAASGTKAIYNEHVYSFIINGNDLPSLLPAGSEIELTITLDRSQQMSVQAFFPYLEYTAEIEVPFGTNQSIETHTLANEIRKAKMNLNDLKEDSSDSNLSVIEEEIKQIEEKFSKDRDGVDNKQEVLSNLRKTLKKIDKLSDSAEWPKLEERLKEEFYKLEEANDELGNEVTTQHVNQIKNDLDMVLRKQDIKLGNALLEQIRELFFGLTLIYQLMGYIKYYNDNFDSLNWVDRNKARQYVNKGANMIAQGPDVEELRQVVVALINLLPEDSPKPLPPEGRGELPVL